MTNNPLTNILTPKARGYLYAAYALAGAVLGVLTIADVDTGNTAEVLAYLGVALGLTAASNASPTPTKAGKRAAGDAGNVDALLLFTVLNTLGIALLLFRVSFK